MMHDLANPTCERTEDLLAFLYGEASTADAKDFERHSQLCDFCKAELASFGNIRESIQEWKHEIVTATSPTAALVTQPRRNRSATAAIREFFSLAPFWMKGAVGLATVLFCLFAVLAVGRLRTRQSPTVQFAKSESIYSEQQLRNAVQKALEEQAANLPRSGKPALPPQQVIRRRPNRQSTPSQIANARRPLTKNEREELAGDLRLVVSEDDDGLGLVNDRLNK
ncbi:MAG: anti-sigma factor [Pyrinomonadaceae bacterium]